MASYYEEGDFAGHWVEDGLGWGGLVETASERRDRLMEEAAQESGAGEHISQHAHANIKTSA